MDILFGDPFYHNIIHHLSIKDLHNLICTCTHYNNHIKKSHIKKTTLTNIKNHLHNIIGPNYDEFKNKVKLLMPCLI